MNGAVSLLQSWRSGRSHAVNVTLHPAAGPAPSTKEQRGEGLAQDPDPGAHQSTNTSIRLEEVRSCEENRFRSSSLPTLWLTELLRTHRENVASDRACCCCVFVTWRNENKRLPQVDTPPQRRTTQRSAPTFCCLIRSSSERRGRNAKRPRQPESHLHESEAPTFILRSQTSNIPPE